MTTLLIGATSAMAEHAARCFAAEGDGLLLAGRDAAKLKILQADLRTRGAETAELLPLFDADDPESLFELAGELARRDFDRALIAFGALPDPEDCEADPEAAARALRVNLEGVVRLCGPVADRLADQGGGTLGVVSSVAGIRGRQSNYHYGAAKGGLNIYLQGLRNRTFERDVRVVTLLPGFVDTPMTADFDKGPLFVSAETAGRRIHRALTRPRGDVVYIPGFWRWILLLIRLVPEPVFKRLSL